MYVFISSIYVELAHHEKKDSIFLNDNEICDKRIYKNTFEIDFHNTDIL